MIRICISCLILLSTIIYCVVEKNNANKILKDNCIEVYLYKEPILPENCVWFKDTEKYDKSYRAAEKSIIDTINNEYLQGKEFCLNNKFDKVLLLKNDDLINYNFEDNDFLIKLSKYQRLFNWEPSMHLKQFVITINKKPILNGYFYNGMMSNFVEDETLMYISVGTDTQYKTKSGFYKTYRKQELCKFSLVNLKKGYKIINLKKDYPELYHAFKNSNRLIE